MYVRLKQKKVQKIYKVVHNKLLEFFLMLIF